jgi:chaperonin cofactor prefoldin
VNDNSDSNGRQEIAKEIEMRVSRIEKSQSDLNKKMKAIEEEIDRSKDLIHGICRSRSFL